MQTLWHLVALSFRTNLINDELLLISKPNATLVQTMLMACEHQLKTVKRSNDGKELRYFSFTCLLVA